MGRLADKFKQFNALVGQKSQLFQLASHQYQQTAISFNVLTSNTKDMSNRCLESGYTDC